MKKLSRNSLQLGEKLKEFVKLEIVIKIKHCKNLWTQSYSSMNGRKIIARDNVGALKTLDGIVITTDNDVANTMNNYLNLVFTINNWIMSHS